MRSAIVPVAVEELVGMDVFSMPELLCEGRLFDCFALAVDMYSGYTAGTESESRTVGREDISVEGTSVTHKLGNRCIGAIY